MTWTASASGSSDPIWYRFRAARAGEDLHIIRDFSPPNTLDWTASQYEGTYEIEVTARDNTTGETAVSSANYQINSAVTGGKPVINPTANPLVFLYSAPPCPGVSSMRVRFESADGVVQYTPYQSCLPPCSQSGIVTASGSRAPLGPRLPLAPCGPELSMNFYLAGLRPNTAYTVNHILTTRSGFENGPTLTLSTPNVTFTMPGITVQQPPPAPGGVLLHSNLYGASYACDVSGNLVWFYSPAITFLTQAEPGGSFISLISPTYVSPTAVYDPSKEILREFDLAGTTLHETNGERINEQLAPLGKRIGALHHDARALPGGGFALLGTTERILTNVQGPGPVDVIGDIILVLDQDLQLVWTWDAFDHLDTTRQASLGEYCPKPFAGCPPLYLASQANGRANDWLHGDALQYLPDGNLLYSSRHQDWVIKIDYSNGAGSGDVIWRMGNYGDFQMQSSDPSPWFSHQHDAGFVPGDPTTLTVFDDGNLRQAVNPNAHSRGQSLKVDEQNKIVTLLDNADLGVFAFALGAAQELTGGDYFFGGGWVILPTPDNYTSRAIETDASGNSLYTLTTALPEYRIYLLNDLYSPTP